MYIICGGPRRPVVEDRHPAHEIDRVPVANELEYNIILCNMILYYSLSSIRNAN